MSERQVSPRHIKTVEDFCEVSSRIQTLAVREESDQFEAVDRIADGRMIYRRSRRLGDGMTLNQSYLLDEYQPACTIVWQRFGNSPGVVSGLNPSIGHEVLAAAQQLLQECPVRQHDEA